MGLPDIVIEFTKKAIATISVGTGGLVSRFKAPTPKELCRKLFLSGEVANMYNAITKLSGFSETAVKELKN